MSPLRRRMIEEMQIRNLAPNTQRVQVLTPHEQSPAALGPNMELSGLRRHPPCCAPSRLSSSGFIL